MKSFDLAARVAIVTGGNGGIGLGMATGLINAGASVVIAGRDRRVLSDVNLGHYHPDHMADAIEKIAKRPEHKRRTFLARH